MKRLALFLHVLVWLKTRVRTTPDDQDSFDVWALANKRAELPCPLRNSLREDQPLLVLWYKDSPTTPIVSYDARESSFGDGNTWIDESVLGFRAYFAALKSPPLLVIEPSHYSDHGVYTCRVDYTLSPTSSTKINLTVIIPPGPPIIFWESRQMVVPVGPVREGTPTHVICRSFGGRPPPVVTWWHQGQEMERQVRSEDTTLDGRTVVSSKVNIVASRSLLGPSLSCHASLPSATGIVLQPKITKVSINVTLSPVALDIEGHENPVSAGATVRLVCRARGSNPPAKVSWWKSGNELSGVIQAILERGNITTAEVILQVTSADNGAFMTCTASNPSLAEPPLVQSFLLHVLYKPELELLLKKPNSSLSQNVQEGQELRFECSINANPDAQLIRWYHNGIELTSDVSSGIIIDRWLLDVTKVTKDHAGTYSCSATNSQGTTSSNVIQITVLYTPECASGWSKRTQGLELGLQAAVICRVEALPATNLSFSWKWLLEDDSFQPIPAEMVESEGLVSRMMVKPETVEDFGPLLCEATNSVGHQKEPCRIHLVPAGKPEPPINCTAEFGASPSVSISCIEGFDGGFHQKFHLQLWQNNQSIANLTSEFPEWELPPLQDGKEATMRIVASNAKGFSQAVRLEIHVPASQLHSRAGETASRNTLGILAPLLGALGGVVVVFFLILLAVVLMARRSRRKRPEKLPDSDSYFDAHQLSRRNNQSGGDPDVVSSVQHRSSAATSLDVVANASIQMSPRTPLIQRELQATRIVESSGSDTDSGSECDELTDLTAPGRAKAAARRVVVAQTSEQGRGCCQYATVTTSEQCLSSRSQTPISCGCGIRSGYQKFLNNNALINERIYSCPYIQQERGLLSPVYDSSVSPSPSFSSRCSRGPQISPQLSQRQKESRLDSKSMDCQGQKDREEIRGPVKEERREPPFFPQFRPPPKPLRIAPLAQEEVFDVKEDPRLESASQVEVCFLTHKESSV